MGMMSGLPAEKKDEEKRTSDLNDIAVSCRR